MNFSSNFQQLPNLTNPFLDYNVAAQDIAQQTEGTKYIQTINNIQEIVSQMLMFLDHSELKEVFCIYTPASAHPTIMYEHALAELSFKCKMSELIKNNSGIDLNGFIEAYLLKEYLPSYTTYSKVYWCRDNLAYLIQYNVLMLQIPEWLKVCDSPPIQHYNTSIVSFKQRACLKSDLLRLRSYFE